MGLSKDGYPLLECDGVIDVKTFCVWSAVARKQGHRWKETSILARLSQKFIHKDCLTDLDKFNAVKLGYGSKVFDLSQFLLLPKLS